MGVDKYKEGFKVSIHEDALGEPYKLKRPHTIFVCSMSDIFHKDVPYRFIDKVIRVIESTPLHRYQILTKRADRMFDYFSTHRVPENVWLGVTVECKASIPRMDYLRRIKEASVRFLSCEPLVEDLGELNLDSIDWIIVGGESGNQARPMKEEWALSIQQQVNKAGKAFFFKQWGTWGSDGVKRNKHVNGKKLAGKICQAVPTPA
jgi:protein gp37